MPRSNRPRRQKEKVRPSSRIDQVKLDEGQLENKRGYDYRVQKVGVSNAKKKYTCPGCNIEIDIGTAHVVSWRQDGLMGHESDLAERRHWHSHCWRIF